MDNAVKQKEVVDWFDKMYARRGEFYLRPVRAYYVFLTLLNATNKDKLLDVACGLGRLLEAASEYGCELTGIDISSVAVEKAKQKLPNANISVANAEELPFESNHFDLITCLGSLERMINLNKVLNELFRVGKPDAKYCFLVRNSNTASWKYLKKGLGLQNKKGHQGANSLMEWNHIFDACGFKVEDVWPDQYPIFKKQLLKSFGLRSIDYKTPLRGSISIENANEFIFILSKA
ncbi:MAG: class I SAM-dependent methyltransferase [Bacteroidota bacterium]